MASGAAIEFVPARRPEAVRMDVSSFKVIKPEVVPISKNSRPKYQDAEGAKQREGSTTDSSEDVDFEVSSEESPAEGSSSSESMEDSEMSNTDESEGESSDSNTSSERAILPNSPRKPLEAEPVPPAEQALPVKKSFYDIDENSSDRGTRIPKRIHKSWHASAQAPAGLQNRGVTCYMNSAIQAMLHLPAVGRYLLDVLSGAYPKVSRNSVTFELAALFRKMMEKSKAVYPHRMLRRLDDINPMLDEWQQEDSHEYYMSLLSRLQEDGVPKGEKLRSSIIHDIFGGSMEQRVTCKECETVSTTHQDFYDLPVSFSSHESGSKYTLTQSIKDFFTPEILPEGENGYQCEKCKRRTRALKCTAIAEAPEYLTVHIKRFRMDGNVSKKVKETLKYPVEMSMTQYEVDSLPPLQYKLIAVIFHEGRTLSSGHYVAIARQPNKTWVMYDDDIMRPVPESFVESHPSAYILIYSRLLEKPRKLSPGGQTSRASGDAQLPSNRAGTKAEIKHGKVSVAAAQSQTKSSHSSSNPKSTKTSLAKRSHKNKVKAGAHSGPAARVGETKQAAKASNEAKRRVSADSIDEIFGRSKKRRA